SRYEGHSVGETIDSQLAACGLSKAGSAAACDFQIIVHGTQGIQGDQIRLPGLAEANKVDTRRQVESTIRLLEAAETPVVLCDVVYANGADNNLLEALMSRADLIQKLHAYAGW